MSFFDTYKKMVLKRPRYREGYFRFDILKAGKAWRSGQTVCLFTDQFDRDVGAGFLPASTTSRSGSRAGERRLHSGVVGAIGREGHALAEPGIPTPPRAPVSRMPGPPGQPLVYGRVGVLAMLASSFARQLVDEETLKWERKGELEGLIGNGRPHWWRQARYQALRNELDQLEDELRWREERVASVQHARLIHAEWYRAAEVQDRFTAFTNFYVDDGQPIVDYNRTKARPDSGFHRPARPQAMDFSSLDDLSEPHSR